MGKESIIQGLGARKKAALYGNPNGAIHPIKQHGIWADVGKEKIERKTTAVNSGGFLCGGPKGIRTLDLSDANRTLSQLSYRPMYVVFPAKVCAFSEQDYSIPEDRKK